MVQEVMVWKDIKRFLPGKKRSRGSCEMLQSHSVPLPPQQSGFCGRSQCVGGLLCKQELCLGKPSATW